MTTPPPLTRIIGQAERALQALLARQLAASGTSFAAWVAMTLLYGGRMSEEQLGAALAEGNVVGRNEAAALIAALIERGTIATEAGTLGLTRQGAAFYEPLRAAVGGATATLFRDIAPGDLDATRRTLDVVARRAAEMTAGA